MDGALAEVMHRERDRRSWRQVDLAKHLQWPLSRVTRIEGGSQRVLVGDLLDLCRVLEMGVAELLFKADPLDLQILGLQWNASAGPYRANPAPARGADDGEHSL